MIALRTLLLALLAPCLAAVAAPAPAAEPADPLRPYLGAVTYVDFWASWCAPCAESFPWLNTLQARYGARGLRVVAVGLDEQVRNGERFLAAHPARFPVLRDPEGHLAERYAVQGMPYAVLLDAQGRVLHRHAGYRPGDVAEYEKAIEAALAAKGVTP